MDRLYKVIYGALFIILWKDILGVNTSIAGVTYIDDFDFEERYEDINECNPFYWHPLHLPEECFQIFETLIRSRLAFSPYRIFKQKEQKQLIYPYTFINAPLITPEVFEEVHTPPPSSPLEVLFKWLKRDIMNNPSGPTIETSPYFGTIAMYKQPISYKSVTLIKKLARLYANAFPTMDLKTQENIEYEKDKKKSEINQKIKTNGNTKQTT
ncbi:uncharacterized protein LOC116777595 [Danaus plexippus]|uniref:uncharacterized protein LOC116777595 n=1 Tax=Danaus plexippus TaxID=13037 RepID=UPI002AB29737|nr:uncharacterized protein LOC116777595 [Danaus plexippus]